MVSFTVTEKAYSITDSAGSLTAEVTSDMEVGPDKAASYMGKLTALLYARYRRGALPVAMVSMDNCSHNGDKLKAPSPPLPMLGSVTALLRRALRAMSMTAAASASPGR